MCAATPGFLAAFVLVRCAYYTARAATPHSTLPECISSSPRLASAAGCSIFTVYASSSVLTES